VLFYGQWNRLRAALFLLLRKASVSDISDRGAAIIVACVVAECEIIHHQCAAGPESKSSLFTEGIFDPDTDTGVAAGLFVRCIAEVLQSVRRSASDQNANSVPNCIHALNAAKVPVLTSFTLPCPAPRKGAFIDPRPTVSEAWLQAMLELAEMKPDEPIAETLLVETCATVVSLLFMPAMGRTQAERLQDSCQNLDGPQSLALTAFLITFFRLGAESLYKAGQILLTTIPVDMANLSAGCPDARFHGVSIISASLFRACQGALPPWAVESIPEVYSSFFEAFGSDAESFGHLMRLGMEVRLGSREYGGVGPGKLLSGRFFESLSETAKTTFINQSRELCKKGGMASWRRLKVLIKQACGGKKKDTEFNQKPSATRWEFERV